MNFKALKCPNCDSSINDIEDELDMFFCKYCGYKIILDGQSGEAYSSKTKIKKMKHKEIMRDKSYEFRKHKMSREDKKEKSSMTITLILIAIFFSVIFIIMINGERESELLELELQATLEEIMIDIENENFDDAYIKANTLYWDSSYTSEGEEKWNATREAVLDQIEDAEKEASKESDDSGFFNWFD